jgi:predicted TIM-barrel fold metal-dependent hydrolase
MFYRVLGLCLLMLSSEILLSAQTLPPQFRSKQAPSTTASMTIEEYEPKSMLVVLEHPVKRTKFPFIDVHNHQDGRMSRQNLERLVREMDSINMRVMVNLSGENGERLKGSVENMDKQYPKRFITFANVDFSIDRMDDPDFGKKAAAQLEQDYKNGARGLKIYKNLGLTVRDGSNRRIPTDDPRLDPIWQKCAELGIPVLIHTGEPKSFFDPHDRFNERWLELKQFPNRARPGDVYPPWEQVMQEQRNLFRKHPRTKFIAAHFAWLGNDLKRLGEVLDSLPNVSTEFGAIIAELGRQPRAAREFFIKHQDRLLFGKDTWEMTEYHTYFRVLETDDEYFDYFRKRHAFWKMYGLNLPDDVLKKIYYKNALKLFPHLNASEFPQ